MSAVTKRSSNFLSAYILSQLILFLLLTNNWCHLGELRKLLYRAISPKIFRIQGVRFQGALV